MSDTAKPFAFSQFVPGFDFLKTFAAGAGGAAPSAAAPGLSNWVAPTLNVEEVDKRIQELKTVQYWLEQNGHALKATIQALEVQKMTLSTLRGMNVRMEDLASAFTRTTAAASAATSAADTAPAASAWPPAAGGFRAPQAPAPAPAAPSPPPSAAASPAPSAAASQPEATAQPADQAGADSATASAAPAAGVVDPLQWWGALTEQFGQIANSALQDAAKLQMPLAAAPAAATKKRASTPTNSRAGATKGSKKSADKPTTARKRSAAKR